MTPQTEASLAATGVSACAASFVCNECPAGPICRDTSLATQIAALLASPRPSIVNTVRAATLIRSHR